MKLRIDPDLSKGGFHIHAVYEQLQIFMTLDMVYHPHRP